MGFFIQEYYVNHSKYIAVGYKEYHYKKSKDSLQVRPLNLFLTSTCLLRATSLGTSHGASFDDQYTTEWSPGPDMPSSSRRAAAQSNICRILRSLAALFEQTRPSTLVHGITARMRGKNTQK